mgnify:CR=1 FL=1
MRFLYHYTKPISTVLFLAFAIVLGTTTTAVASGDTFCDYLPKYRKYKSHYQIDKIFYEEKRTIVHFRFVAQADEKHTFYSGDHPNSWYLRTPRRMRGVEIQFRQLELKGIRVNNELKLASLVKIPDISYEINRGDVVTFEVHFVRIPQYLRMLDLIEGKDGADSPDKLNCFDILIKTKENPLLGTPSNEEQVVTRFESTFDYIQPKKEVAPTNTIAATDEEKPTNNNQSTPPTLNADRPNTSTTNNEEKTAKAVAVVENKMPEPIDYMPNSLVGLEDLKCDQHVVMPDVNFKESETSFSGRIKAIQNIRIIAEYLKQYPKSHLNIYGHTDIYGSDYKNRNLSRERGFAVKRELVKMGIDSDRIEVFFFGGERPLPKYKNGGDENRRVEVQPVCNPGG